MVSELAFRSLFDLATDCMLVLNEDGCIKEINHSGHTQLGYTKAEMLGKHISQFILPEFASILGERMAELIEKGHLTFESAQVRKDGSVLPVEISSKTIEIDGRKAFFSVVRDIADRKKIEQALKSREERFQTLFDRASEGILIVSTNGKLIAANESFAKMHGYTPQEMQTMNLHDLDPPESAALIPERMRRLLSEESLIFEVENYRKDGSIFPMEVSASLIKIDGEPVVQSFVRDITERKAIEKQLRVLVKAFETYEAIMVTDANGYIIRVNEAFQKMTGYRAEEVIGKNPRILSSGRQSKKFYEDMWRELLTNGAWSGELWDKRKNGQIYPKWQTITSVRDENDKISEFVAISSDITSQKRSEEEIHHLAFYDFLTGLPNRRLLTEQFHSTLAVSARSLSYGAVLLLDMDKFKILNDTLGHEYGDLLLIEVSQRISSCIRDMDFAARLGGDEFVVLLKEINKNAERASQQVALITEKIRTTLSEPYQLRDHLYHCSPSIGVCLFRGNEVPVDTLLKHADMAMYEAKDAGRNAARFFDPAMQLAVETHAALEADLRSAASNQQLQLYYQIQMDRDHHPIGAEALIRWIHPIRGMVSPAQFIPIAEESSLIIDIGDWVLDSACRQLAEWAKNDKTRNLLLAVNVSAKQFKQQDFVEKVIAILDIHEVDASRLKLELTESVVLSDLTEVVTKMQALRVIGVRLSMDDFGTGYSSLSYLKLLPIDQIKIDQSFVRDIAIDPNDAVMVKTIIDLAKNFRLNVIAEGVETKAQLDFLEQNGCMAYQGYFFSRPVPIEQFETLL